MNRVYYHILSELFPKPSIFVLLYVLFLGGKLLYKYIGIYKTPPIKYIGRPINIKKSKNAKKICERFARQGRYKVFAIRGGRQCFVSRSTPRKFVVLGPVASRKPRDTIKVYIREKGTSSLQRLL